MLNKIKIVKFLLLIIYTTNFGLSFYLIAEK